MRKKTYEEVKNYIEVESKSGYILLSKEYISARKKLKIKCNKGHIFEMRFNNFKDSNQRCKICVDTRSAESKRHSYDYVRDYIKLNSKYELISTEYKNVETKLLIKCEKGHIYDATFHDFKSGYRCSECRESKGEKSIIKYLSHNDIYFEKQYKIKECKNKRQLPFDFAILNNKNELLFLIEYHGKQHYEIGCFSSNKEKMTENFKYIQLRDEIKEKYCKDNNIKLIIIPYWEFDNIKNILNNELKGCKIDAEG